MTRALFATVLLGFALAACGGTSSPSADGGLGESGGSSSSSGGDDAGSCPAGTFLLEETTVTTMGPNCADFALPSGTIVLDGGAIPFTLHGGTCMPAPETPPGTGCVTECTAMDDAGNDTLVTFGLGAEGPDAIGGTYTVTVGMSGQSPKTTCSFALSGTRQ